MYLPSSRELLHTWDAGSGRDHTSRALLLLQSAHIDGDVADLADLNVGRRDRLLLDLREGLFGTRIDALEQCPACGADLELTFEVADVRADDPGASSGQIRVQIDGRDVLVRLPTSRDMRALAECGDLQEARDLLMARCLQEVDGSAGTMRSAALPRAMHEAIAREMSLADPQAVVTLALECALCGHDWQTHFDIVEYLWAEMESLARRMIRDVHTLATAYGWSETAILELSPQRRRLYMELVTDG